MASAWRGHRGSMAPDLAIGYPHGMGMHRRLDPRRIEVVDDEMAAVLRAKSGAERLAIAFGMYESARRMLTSMLRADHPDWSEDRLAREVARRLSHDAG